MKADIKGTNRERRSFVHFHELYFKIINELIQHISYLAQYMSASLKADSLLPYFQSKIFTPP